MAADDTNPNSGSPNTTPGALPGENNADLCAIDTNVDLGMQPRTKNVDLSAKATKLDLGKESLRELVATEVLRLFRYSLQGTLAFAAVLTLIDAAFILIKVITPDQRLMTERIIMTFITATVVQVGAALAAIVFAVFKAEPTTSD